MTSVFYLHKRSEKLKRMFKNTATALNIDGYAFFQNDRDKIYYTPIKGSQSSPA